ncbi:MAG: penicillin-binding protein 2 [Patescibacteria group bacterium]
MDKKDQFFFITEDIDIGRRSSLEWVEESFDLAADSKHWHSDFLSLSLSRKKLAAFFSFLIFVLLILAAKSFYLQTFKGDYYFSLAENNRIKVEYLKAQRGIIYDRNGKNLVYNISGFSLLVTPAGLPKELATRRTVLERISQISAVPVNEIETKIESANKYYYEPIVIKTGIAYEEAMALKIASAEMVGVDLESDAWRQYPLGEGFSHLLGYVGKINAEEFEKNKSNYLFSDNIGKTGLEKYYERELRGEYGEKRIEVDSLGREKKIISQTESVAGSDLVLAVDADLESRVHEILKKYLSSGKAASVIVSNPQNGEILALVDYPSYDNNLFAQGISQEDYQKLIDDPRKPLLDRSVSGEYPSGSTIKPVMASAALQEKIIDRNTSFLSVGGIRIGQWFFPDWKAGGHGVTNVIKALAWSINTFFYYIGGGYGDFGGLGVDRIDKYLTLFGAGEQTGIDLPNEKTGFVPTPAWKEEEKGEAWYIGDTYHLSIGQGDLLVTPLQINSFTATVANGGKIYQPHLVKEIIHPNNQREKIEPKIIRENFIDSANLAMVREGMREAVLSGSAAALRSLPIAAAAKTGTAQWNTKKQNHAWFTAFAPYDNPNFAITVLVEEGGEGSAIAAPIARDIMAYWFGR